MKGPRHSLFRNAACWSLLCMAPLVPARGQDAPPAGAAKRWSDSAELGYVATAGNSETATLGFKNTLGRKWASSAFEMKAGGVRATTTTVTRSAVGTAADFSVIEDKDTVVSAENYFLNGQYDWKVSPRAYWFAGAGWSRNRFAGIQNRYESALGLGNIWADGERLKFRTEYALSYTREDDVVETPGVSDSFPGFRFSSKLARLMGTATTWGNDLVIDENLDDTTDLRANMVNSLAVAMSKRLALKMSLQWLYDHQPASTRIDLFAAPPPGVPIGAVLDPLKTLDTIFTSSLVVNF